MSGSINPRHDNQQPQQSNQYLPGRSDGQINPRHDNQYAQVSNQV